MRPPSQSGPDLCFVGIRNLPALVPQFAHLGTGGAELQQVLLAKALVRRGLKVSMIVADLGQPNEACWNGISTIRAHRPDSGLPGLRFLTPRWTGLNRALRRAAAPAYYVSCAGVELGQVVHFARRRGRRTIFRIAHDFDCDPAKLRLRFRRDRWLYRYGLRRADLVLAQTEAQRNDLLQHYGVNSIVVPSMPHEPGRDTPYCDRTIDLLWVGRVRPIKRPDRILALASRRPDLRVHLVGGVVPGEERFFDEIAARARSLPNVTFHGSVPYDHTGAIFERSRLLVSTSDGEGFPNTFVQAWSRGVPVVSFLDPTGVISRNGLGALVASQEELEREIDRLLNDGERWHDARRRSIEYSVAQFDPDEIVDQYLNALAKVSSAAAEAAGPKRARKTISGARA